MSCQVVHSTLTFIGSINSTSEFQSKKTFLFSIWVYEQLKYHAQLRLAGGQLYNLKALKGAVWSGIIVFA